jgi:hypothetical protein
VLVQAQEECKLAQGRALGEYNQVLVQAPEGCNRTSYLCHLREPAQEQENRTSCLCHPREPAQEQENRRRRMNQPVLVQGMRKL